MFRLLVRPIGVLLALCACGVLLAMALPGRAIEPPAETGALGFETCLPPCWAGIMVGETAFADVGVRFEHNVAARQKNIDFANGGAMYWAIAEAQTAPRRTAAFSGNLFARAGTPEVTYIHLNVEIPLWYLLLSLGSPAEVEVHQQFADIQRVEMVMRWALPEANAAATLHMRSAGDWGLQMTVSSLTITTPGELDGLGFALRSYRSLGLVPWQGFRPFEDYVREAATQRSADVVEGTSQPGL